MRTTPLLLLFTLTLAACDQSGGSEYKEPAAAQTEAAADAGQPRAEDQPTLALIGDDMTFNGEPVDPICFAPYLMGEDSGHNVIQIDPATCAPGYHKTDEHYSPGENAIGTGFYMGDDPEEHSMRAPFIEYRLVGKTKDGIALSLMGSGGGTGVFSGLLTATRKGDTLVVNKNYAGGDRCNGGITESRVTKDGKLAYAQSITPYDFITLGREDEPQGIKAYDDLTACAACCIGEALYEDGAFTGVRLAEKYVATETTPEQTVQACFDSIMTQQDTMQWSAAEFALLRDRIRGECRHD